MNPKTVYHTWTKRERIIGVVSFVVFVLSSITRTTLAINEWSVAVPVAGGTYREGVVGQPIAINPIISANPVDADISSLLYASLGSISSNIEKKKDEVTYTIKIKEGLVWSNGQPLTSNDIIFTIQTIQNPEASSPLYETWRGATTERISELQVQITLSSPYAFFLNHIENLFVIPKHIYGTIPAANLRLSAYNLEPVGSGPYIFKSFLKRKDGFISEYRLERNETYHGEKPFIKKFYLIFFEKEEDALKAFKLRQIDGFGTTNPENIIEAKKTIENGGGIIEKIPMSRYYAIFFNPNINGILKQQSVRTALDNAIDKERITKEVFGENIASPVSGPFMNKKDSADYSSEEIRSLLEKARGKDERIVINLIVPQISFLEKTAGIIKKNWEDAGVDEVNLLTLPLDDLMENVVKTNNYEALLFGNVLDVSEDIYPFWHSSQRFYPGLNLALYKNQRADMFIEKIRQTENKEEREIYKEEAEQIINGESPAAFLFSLPYLYVHAEKLKGFGVKSEPLSLPKERFGEVTKWHTKEARALKKQQTSPRTEEASSE
ncbi:hypothetical protein A3A21_00590 [Candidatus Jorgensenbacteria bacterium RIFCSPLOWO2_01_FULL_45_25b]|uniref:Solute-binding protein family 5 domain-containing protein n=1 Tax=Candidatus Jorgensenbacteria bacterium RIFCSPLOWO2_01_FULL_45_25b TaxID=1798471 RepID=A0A1F6BYS4_9BACT|nr:MAG: hypothetical protein A3A21_00590 [Candidatus Jorgensenbacteria bacterium RIFCSPLOWO2_01_FULL_45_25b]